MKCWIITEGLAGTENQCIGVAEALGVEAEIKRVALRQPWKSLSPWLGFESAQTFEPAPSPPWPDLLIASGRKSIAASRYIRKASKGKTFTVQIQDPRISPVHFDLVAVPEHDPSRGSNVIVTAASPNRITTEKLVAAREKFAEFEKLTGPRVAVLVGGDSKSHKMTREITMRLAEQLKKLDAGLMVTTSRRTGEENTRILKDALSGPNIFIWDGSGENPYFGMLAWADFILVTKDSASMLSDAATTGKPVYVIPLEGGSKRLDKLHENLREKGITRPFDGRLENWSYERLQDSQKIAREIRARLAGHMAGQV
ncbi:MAG: mitochondrial fission ELM1 family protein [Alphaproteobacteria bacterium]